MTRRGLHSKIVREILPRLAERLKGEGVISSYDRKPFIVRLLDHMPPFRIAPDLVLHVYDKGKVLIEIANPRDPKRFVGELVYPLVLGHFNEIVAAIIFVLQQSSTERGMIQNFVLHLIPSERAIPTLVMTWSEDDLYWNLKYLITKRLFPKRS